MSAHRSQMQRLWSFAPALLVAGAAWWVCGLTAASLREREEQDREMTANLYDQIDRAAAPIREIGTLETAVNTFRSQLDRLEQEMPGPSVLNSMPDELQKHFARFDLTVSATPLSTTEEVEGLPGCSRGSWSVTLPLVENDPKAAQALHAVAEFEEQHPFVKVVDFVIRPDVENPKARVAALNLTALFRK